MHIGIYIIDKSGWILN